MINGQRRENRSSNFQSIIHKQKLQNMNNGWATSLSESGEVLYHSEWSLIDIYYFFVLCLIFFLMFVVYQVFIRGFVEDFDFSCAFLLFYLLLLGQFCGHCCFYDFLKNMEICLHLLLIAGRGLKLRFDEGSLLSFVTETTKGFPSQSRQEANFH